jgi:hypothetical protein
VLSVLQAGTAGATPVPVRAPAQRRMLTGSERLQFEDAQEFAAMRESIQPGGPKRTKLLMGRCTADAASTIADTFVGGMCYDARGCCNTARGAMSASASFEQPISSTMTLDAEAQMSPALVDE